MFFCRTAFSASARYILTSCFFFVNPFFLFFSLDIQAGKKCFSKGQLAYYITDTPLMSTPFFKKIYLQYFCFFDTIFNHLIITVTIQYTVPISLSKHNFLFYICYEFIFYSHNNYRKILHITLHLL